MIRPQWGGPSRACKSVSRLSVLTLCSTPVQQPDSSTFYATAIFVTTNLTSGIMQASTNDNVTVRRTAPSLQECFPAFFTHFEQHCSTAARLFNFLCNRDIRDDESHFRCHAGIN